jgi:catechol 1,2-dioxygenase
MCDDVRQEYILLSDVLGATILVDAINHRNPEGTTESSVLGPFYREGAPVMPRGTSIAGDTDGEAVTVRGRVTAVDGTPIEGAVLDVWQTAPNGLYEVQDPGQPDFNLTGRFQTATDGTYEFHTVKPVSYSIPEDGPVGQLLRALGRHTFRPAHIHFIVSADGYQPVVTQLFTAGDAYLDSDAVFGVKNSLVVDYERKGEGYRVEYDFGLEPAA